MHYYHGAVRGKLKYRKFCWSAIGKHMHRWCSKKPSICWKSQKGKQLHTHHVFLKHLCDSLINLSSTLTKSRLSLLEALGKAIPVQAWTGPEGPRRVSLPDCKSVDTWRWKVCQPYTLAAFTSQEIFLVLISVRGLSRAQGHNADGRVLSVKNFNDTIGNRTRDLSACTRTRTTSSGHKTQLTPTITQQLMKNYFYITVLWFMTARGLPTFRKSLLHTSYNLKKAAVYSSEFFVITYETRHFHNSKEHKTRHRCHENNKLYNTLILNAFTSMEKAVYCDVISGREMSSKGLRERETESVLHFANRNKFLKWMRDKDVLRHCTAIRQMANSSYSKSHTVWAEITFTISEDVCEAFV
jgi:hypothetical protein